MEEKIMAKLEYQEKDGKVFCPLVNKWLVAKPEEKVRQRYCCPLTGVTMAAGVTRLVFRAPAGFSIGV